MTPTEPKNTAGRLAQLLEAASRGNPDKPFVDIWAVVLGLEPKSGRIDHEVARLLTSMVVQLDTLQVALLKQGVPNGLVDDPINRVVRLLSLAHLRTHWKSLAGNLSPDVLVSFRWFEHVLPSEQTTIDDEALGDLLMLLDQLEALTFEDGLPALLREYLVRVLNDIRTAMSYAPVAGMEPLKAAIRKTVADVTFEKEKLDAALAQASPSTAGRATGIVGQVVKKAAEVSGDVEKISKVVKLAGEGVEWLAGLIK